MWKRIKDWLIEFAIRGAIKAGLRDKIIAIVNLIADKIELKYKNKKR